MRWKHRGNSWPSLGTIEIRSWFAWMPVTIGLETRWLEKVRVQRRYFREGEWENLFFLRLEWWSNK